MSEVDFDATHRPIVNHSEMREEIAPDEDDMLRSLPDGQINGNRRRKKEIREAGSGEDELDGISSSCCGMRFSHGA
jgi:hypothetical protein